MKIKQLCLALGLALAACLPAFVPRPSVAAVQRVELQGLTGSQVTTTVTVSAPTLLQPVREDFMTVSGVGEVRIGMQPTDSPSPPGVSKLYPPAWINGDIWLPTAGDWDITVRTEAEDGQAGLLFSQPYLLLSSPDSHLLDVAMRGLGAGRSQYHAEAVSTWCQIMKLEHRMGVRQDMTLTARGGDLRYRWAGPPSSGPEGNSYNLVKDGTTVLLGPAPLASLWARADGTGTVIVNLSTQRLR